MGIETTYSERDDLLYNGVKFSGNAQHIFQQKKRVLHHGTLLLNANIHNLGKALHSEGQYQDKAVKSNKSSVTNLGYHFPDLQKIDQTIATLAQKLATITQSAISSIQPNEDHQIKQLKTEKFVSLEWIFGYSPSYQHQRVITAKETSYHLKMTVTKGIITEFTLYDEHGNAEFTESCQASVNQPIAPQTFASAFANTLFQNEAEYNQFF